MVQAVVAQLHLGMGVQLGQGDRQGHLSEPVMVAVGLPIAGDVGQSPGWRLSRGVCQASSEGMSTLQQAAEGHLS